MNLNFNTIKKNIETSNIKLLLQPKTANLKNINPEKLIYVHNTLTKFPNNPKDILQNVLGNHITIQSIWQSFDLGRLGNPLFDFQKNVKLYNAFDKTTSKFTDYITCYKEKGNKIKKFVIYNCKNKDLKFLDANGNIQRHYTPQETKALMSYKHDSSEIHKFLRYNILPKKEDKKQLLNENITNLSAIFNNNKTSKTTQDIVVYRALDKKSLKAILAMQKDGMVFEESSFMSVATKKKNVFPFLNLHNFNHIMKIKLHKNTPYLKMDEIGNAVILQSPENELVLNKGAKLLITSKKGKNGMIEAELI